MNGFETAGLICAMIFGGISCVVSIVALMKKQDTQISPQPLEIKIDEELHEQFAAKKEFEALVHNNTKRHGELFNKIDAVERQARHELEQRMSKLNEERSATLEKLNNQFTFIRENIASINTELQIRRDE